MKDYASAKSLWNTMTDVDHIIDSLKEAIRFLEVERSAIYGDADAKRLIGERIDYLFSKQRELSDLTRALKVICSKF